MSGLNTNLIRGVRVDGDEVIVVAKDKSAARFVGSKLIGFNTLLAAVAKSQADDATIAHLRADVLERRKEVRALTSEIETLRAKSKGDSATIATLLGEVSTLRETLRETLLYGTATGGTAPNATVARPARACLAGSENPCLPCFLDHGDCVAPPFDGVEEAQMATRAAALRSPYVL